MLDNEARDGDDAPQIGYNELLFFDFECRVVQNEAGDEWVFEGDNTRNKFCEWLFTKEHANCIVLAHNFQGYDDKQSLLVLKWLSYKAEKEDLYIQHARNAGEKRVGNYLLDGYHEETNTAYEINGMFEMLCSVNPVSGKTMQDLHQATMEKISYLKDHGFGVIEVWECDIRKELEQDEDLKTSFDNYDLVDPLEPRDAFFGGRTNCSTNVKMVRK
ncbi:DNA polymerase [Paramuricea clavata]|uniref:DNA polymerase n=1 Tax=Paramuricea clavata TaxID=317549 RepID=A0A6S7G959_PARCT|nr:DNA polymerase [Paramuricea clavata]